MKVLKDLAMDNAKNKQCCQKVGSNPPNFSGNKQKTTTCNPL